MGRCAGGLRACPCSLRAPRFKGDDKLIMQRIPDYQGLSTQEKPPKISMFICPCCGGNDTEEKEGKTYCAYCGTLVRGKKTYNSSPLENIKPKLLPLKTVIW